MSSSTKPCSVVVLISGNGSNLQAIIDDSAKHSAPYQIVAVISSRADAYGLMRAKKAGIASHSLDHKQFDEREKFDHALLDLIDSYSPDLLILAGFMRILSNDFVLHYQGRLLNIHPSLLPKYQGLNTHQRALDAGDKKHGVSVHFVTAELDGGPVVLQAELPILPNDNAEALAQRVLKQEHKMYPQVIRWFAENRLSTAGNTVTLDTQVLSTPLLLNTLEKTTS
ncbi:MAG: phosphoribosylglycinamide formyltransferase [Gammaproteobacteria bacterium]|nr:phosphoribosylglycinamide formyltransferase [Gammaproteobacteria bacterium]